VFGLIICLLCVLAGLTMSVFFSVMPASPISSRLYISDGVTTLTEIEIPSSKMGDYLTQEKRMKTM
jgi:hypothetical protein